MIVDAQILDPGKVFHELHLGTVGLEGEEEAQRDDEIHCGNGKGQVLYHPHIVSRDE